MRSLVSVATMGFAVESPNTTNTAWTDTTFKIKSVIETQLAVTDEKWMEHWYGGVILWWFVQAVLLKFWRPADREDKGACECQIKRR